MARRVASFVAVAAKGDNAIDMSRRKLLSCQIAHAGVRLRGAESVAGLATAMAAKPSHPSLSSGDNTGQAGGLQ